MKFTPSIEFDLCLQNVNVDTQKTMKFNDAILTISKLLNITILDFVNEPLAGRRQFILSTQVGGRIPPKPQKYLVSVAK